ncbi:hypothetical protein [Shouchella miscanthi]|uniref:Uncharacterized protein n=1 Tax=Shouchella miscanthi TaxID=2598861 RepID=A0ABU6NMR4_9BACI|nr:hypothetical protein [Shouchella miscanthi]
MTNLQIAKEAYEKAVEIEGRSDSNIHAFKDVFQPELNEIQADQTLSRTGKNQKREELIAKMGKSMMDLFKKEKTEHQEMCVKANVRAQSVLVEPTKKPHETDIALHDKQMQELKMESLFNSPKAVSDKIKQYAAIVKDPYIAEQMINDLPGIYDRLNSRGAQTQEINTLSQVYNTLKLATVTPEREEAQRIYDATKDRSKKNLYLPLHENFLRERLGTKYSNNINNPNYFID